MTICVSGSELAFPACVVNGTGVSKTFQILYRNEEVLLDDVIMFRAHILVDSHKVSTKVQDVYKVHVQYSASSFNSFEACMVKHNI
jgi:hypothetical protein